MNDYLENPDTILKELYKTVHGFWDAETNEKVPGVIDIQEEQGKEIRQLTKGQWWIGSGVIATFVAVLGSGHLNGAVLVEIFKLLSKLVTP